MPPTPQTTKLTSTLHLLIPRLRLLQKKSTASSVIQRRELSQLLSENKDASARIRVENVIATDIAVEVMEMVELYCELILARANVLDQNAFSEKGVEARNRAKEAWVEMKRKEQGLGSGSGSSGPTTGKGDAAGSGKRSGFGFGALFGGGGASKKEEDTSSSTAGVQSAGDEAYIDSALDEAAAAIFYAYPRFPADVRELTILRQLLADRYGKEFMTLAQDDRFPEADGLRVPERLVKGLRVRPPSQELVESYLREIARAYGVVWGGDAEELGEAPTEFVDGGDNNDATAGGDVPVTPRKEGRPADVERRMSETAELNRATPPKGLQSGKSPVSVAPPGPRSDNPNPRVKVPDGNGKGEAEVEPRSPSKTSKGGIPELDELTRRFAALKR
ncbi:regulator of Vps4 activity in the MVB pathway-domain-containing protein [Aspergillus pseudotamarii]|uniref:Regulator of Vps4 activity in the MVB pathway-domain-containing protein n=1 Tax=Aspergillus pseudotamarii TaxID=132259 RepID=A0A5N6TAN0_ASPPS|nr:regulator of Vps4 activity in the MVB pathway-domain-containing protein [Aspergillus pseudotamarii]KAE8143362.1 regulator of Vps4 activity in the MVB pathway-domain-containing protein [Aspergillus pseudotamarii]